MALTVTSVNPSAAVGVAYSSSFNASGGTAPYTFSYLVGAPPPGLALNASTGALTGTPTLQGIYTYVVQAMDSLGATGTVQFALTVSGGTTPPVSNPTAAHTFDFSKVFLSVREGNSPPGGGGWTLAGKLFDGTTSVGPDQATGLATFSAGGLAPTDDYGITGQGNFPSPIFGGLAFVGNGLPAPPVYVNPDDTQQYWDTSLGSLHARVRRRTRRHGRHCHAHFHNRRNRIVDRGRSGKRTCLNRRV